MDSKQTKEFHLESKNGEKRKKKRPAAVKLRTVFKGYFQIGNYAWRSTSAVITPRSCRFKQA